MRYILLMFSFVSCLFMSCSQEELNSCSDGIQNGYETSIDCGGDCASCELGLEGIYKGTLTISEYYDVTEPDDVFVDVNCTVSISYCASSCIDVLIQHDWGALGTQGSFIKNSSFYGLDLLPILAEDEQDNMEGFENGLGTFDYQNNSLTFTLAVTDNSPPRGTDSYYQFEGFQQ